MSTIREEVEEILSQFASYNGVQGYAVGKTYAYEQLKLAFATEEAK